MAAVTFSDAVRDRLRGLIATHGYSVAGLERAMGKGNCWLARKLDGRRALQVDDVDAVCDFLSIPGSAVLAP